MGAAVLGGQASRRINTATAVPVSAGLGNSWVLPLLGPQAKIPALKLNKVCTFIIQTTLVSFSVFYRPHADGFLHSSFLCYSIRISKTELWV